MSTKPNSSRRLFLQRSGALCALGAGAPLALNLAAMGEAAAQSASASDYRALVCVFLQGGNDSFNTVLATDADSWAPYVAARRQAPSSLALLSAGTPADTSQVLGSPAWLGGIRSLTTTGHAGRSFALHPQLSDLQNLFNTQKKLAIVPNVGPLIEPLTKQEYAQASKGIPKKLFSHNDQQNTWQSFAPEGSTQGWGGLMADLFNDSNGNSLFTAISASGNSVWLSGRQVKQYQLGTSGAVRLGARADDPGNAVFGSDAVGAMLQKIVSNPRTETVSSRHVFAQDIASTGNRSIAAETALRNTLPSASNSAFGPDSRLLYKSLSGANTVNSLAKQLQIVARTISAQASLGVKRQVFFVTLGGFDTHDEQSRNHAELMAKLNHGLAYFNNVLTAIGMSNKVTTFTASDFGRTFTSNGDGTDHGWGGHHFVMGGAVQGGRIHGTFPTLGVMNSNNPYFDSSPNQLRNGVLLPSISVDQYGATLGRWFGVSDSNLLLIFPNLSRFGDASNLGFMQA